MKFATLIASLFLVQSRHAQRVSSIVSPPDQDIFPNRKIVRADNYLVGLNEGKAKGRFMGIGFDATLDKLTAIIYDANMTALKPIPLADAAHNHGPLFTDIQVMGNDAYVIYHEAKGKTGLGNIITVHINSSEQTAANAVVIDEKQDSIFISVFSTARDLATLLKDHPMARMY